MTASSLLYWLWGRQWSGKQTYLVLKLNLVLRLQGKIQSDRKADNRFAVASRLNVCPHRAISKTMQCLTFLWQPFLLYFSHYAHVHYTLQSDVSKAFSYLNSPTPPAWENLISPPFSPFSPLIPTHYFLHFHFRHLCTFLSCAFELTLNFYFLLLMSPFFLSTTGLSLSLWNVFEPLPFSLLPLCLSPLCSLSFTLSVSLRLDISLSFWRWPWRFSLHCVFRHKALSSLPPLCFPHTAQPACLGSCNAPTHVSAFKTAGIQWKYDSLHLNLIMPYQTWKFIFPLFYNKKSWWKSHKLSTRLVIHLNGLFMLNEGQCF